MSMSNLGRSSRFIRLECILGSGTLRKTLEAKDSGDDSGCESREACSTLSKGFNALKHARS